MLPQTLLHPHTPTHINLPKLRSHTRVHLPREGTRADRYQTCRGRGVYKTEAQTENTHKRKIQTGNTEEETHTKPNENAWREQVTEGSTNSDTHPKHPERAFKDTHAESSTQRPRRGRHQRSSSRERITQ